MTTQNAQNAQKPSAKDIEAHVLELYTKALVDGKAARLTVETPNTFKIAYGATSYVHSYTGASLSLAEVLRKLRSEGRWNDKASHGNWEYQLFHNAGVSTTNRAKQTPSAVTPEPEPEPEAPKTAQEQLADLQSKLLAAQETVKALESEIARVTKDAAAELQAEVEAEEKALAERVAALAAKKALLAPKPATAPVGVKPTPVGHEAKNNALAAMSAKVGK